MSADKNVIEGTEARQVGRKFFHYSQNNSGGSFTFEESAGITHHVVIEAENAEAANRKAESIGLYWNGCDDGMDCNCCGDRWYPVYDNDADAEPKVYGRPVATLGDLMAWMPEGKEVVVHYADGRIEWHGASK